jgi:hypothetical protein
MAAWEVAARLNAAARPSRAGTRTDLTVIFLLQMFPSIAKPDSVLP